MSSNDFTVICVECGEPRGFMQTHCPKCESNFQIGAFEKALAEFEGLGDVYSSSTKGCDF